MARRLPPLNAIKSFEAAARHCSMTKAAQELGVSQVAITRAVQLLESRVGSPLFSRNNRQLSLTPKGEEYYRVVNQVLDELSAATNRITRAQDQELRIWTVSLFNWWLLPRLGEFRVAYPGIKIEISSNVRLDNLRSSDFDAVIREAPDDIEQGEGVKRLLPIELTPVCRPAPPFDNIAGYDDLGRYTLLHSAYRPDAWAEWLRFVDCDTVNPDSGLLMDNSGYCFHAAVEGVGVALGQLSLIGREIEQGRLIRPFDAVMTTGKSYYVMANRTRRSAALRNFVRWLSAAATK